MPPPLPAESDAESTVSENPQAKSESVEAQDEVLGDAPDVADEEDEEEEGDEEVYVVEKILAHHDNFADNDMRYEIKWKGYEKKADRTWETEGNLEGARDLLEAYWKEIGGKPVPAKKEKPAGKKRGRQSTGTIQPAAKKQNKPGRKSTTAMEDQDGTPEPPKGWSDVNEDVWQPPPPLDNAWENLVMNVDTIEKDDKGELWAFLVWNEKNEDDRFNRSKAKLATCNKACPQRMLRFYEQHVVFTGNKSSYTEENGNTTA
ncbi:MAG: hypothetical protein L6R42_002791 [Xanthoria sp. 1 TBL-2021]|nr:MAG: hypothetical protein L6R42_002791 [Xanthoria sp. 1 TBL-2021]